MFSIKDNLDALKESEVFKIEFTDEELQSHKTWAVENQSKDAEEYSDEELISLLVLDKISKRFEEFQNTYKDVYCILYECDRLMVNSTLVNSMEDLIGCVAHLNRENTIIEYNGDSEDNDLLATIHSGMESMPYIDIVRGFAGDTNNFYIYLGDDDSVTNTGSFKYDGIPSEEFLKKINIKELI